MLEKKKAGSQTANELSGELSALAERLGSSDLAGLTYTDGGIELGRVRNLSDLRRFLRKYLEQVLLVSELPTIHRAYQHASRSETRELIALDAGLQGGPLLQHLATASQHVGRAQLKKLKPLRDERVVQRYWAAVEKGEAKAWHTVVFGLVLAVFSLPLRQGLLHYAAQTLYGFVRSAAGRLELREADCLALVSEVEQQLPKAVDKIVASESASRRLTK